MTGLSPWAAGFGCRCPSCGRGEVFQGYLRFAVGCAVCGADFAGADAGDGPAVFVTLVVGALVVPFALVLQFGLGLPDWMVGAAALAAAAVLCLALLPPFKATLFALQWRYRAREASLSDTERD